MALPEVASREEWLRARVDKNYAFEGSQGQVSLADMFGDCSQLVIQHIMFGPDWDSACPRCPQVTSELTDSLTERLRSRDTTYAMVCRAPYAKIDAYRGGRNLTVPWYSSYGSDFNYDFQVTLDGAAGQRDYDYQSVSELPADDSFELPGVSCFLRTDRAIFHTYSAYVRGPDHVDLGCLYLDMTASGRPEEWELPRGRAPRIYAT